MKKPVKLLPVLVAINVPITAAMVIIEIPLNIDMLGLLLGVIFYRPRKNLGNFS